MKAKGTTPDTNKTSEIIDQLTQDIATSTDGTILIDQMEAQHIVDTLIWTNNFLNDRRVYHKHQQLKKREIEKIARKLLSADDLAKIDAFAKKQALGAVLPQGEVDGDE